MVKVDPDKPEVLEAARLLREGGVVAYPTDTLYGLGASLHHERALERVYEIKGRDPSKPLLLLIPEVDSLRSLVKEVSDSAVRLMDAFWPGPLTLVFEASDAVPEICLGGGKTIGIRLPDSSVAMALLREVNVPLTASSANRSGGPQPVSAQQVAETIGDQVDLIIDGGPCTDESPSTLVDVSGSHAVLLREGRIPNETLQPFLS